MTAGPGISQPRTALRRAVRRVARRIVSWRYRGFNPSSHEGQAVKVGGLELTVGRGVFDPSLHFTSGFMADFIRREANFGPEDRVLDIGTGSGVLAIAAALSGCAHVVAVDVNPDAVTCARLNAGRHGVADRIEVVEGEFVPPGNPALFDHVVCNPPYFSGEASNIAERAYLAGANLGWFDDFIRNVGPVLSPSGRVLMVLSDTAELDGILDRFRGAGWTWKVAARRDIIIETMYIFELAPQRPTHDR